VARGLLDRLTAMPTRYGHDPAAQTRSSSLGSFTPRAHESVALVVACIGVFPCTSRSPGRTASVVQDTWHGTET
jgi:hypothetical protein